MPWTRQNQTLISRSQRFCFYRTKEKVSRLLEVEIEEQLRFLSCLQSWRIEQSGKVCSLSSQAPQSTRAPNNVNLFPLRLSVSGHSLIDKEDAVILPWSLVTSFFCSSPKLHHHSFRAEFLFTLTGWFVVRQIWIFLRKPSCSPWKAKAVSAVNMVVNVTRNPKGLYLAWPSRAVFMWMSLCDDTFIFQPLMSSMDWGLWISNATCCSNNCTQKCQLCAVLLDDMSLARRGAILPSLQGKG